MLAGMTRQYSKRGGTKSAEGTISVMNHGYLSEMVPPDHFCQNSSLISKIRLLASFFSAQSKGIEIYV